MRVSQLSYLFLQASSGEGERLVTPSSPGLGLPGAPARFGAADPTPPLVLMPAPAPALISRLDLPGSRAEAARPARQPVPQQWPVPRLNRSSAADSGGGIPSPMTMDSAADSANTEDHTAGLDLCSGPRGSKRSKEEVQKRNKEVGGVVKLFG